MSVRLSVNINDETAEVLKDDARKRRKKGKKDASVTESLERAIWLFKELDDEVNKEGKLLYVVDHENNTEQRILLLG